ncbi:hypothetical protein TNCV_1348731 [Trichonephila clavipes]|nr:hypothetical protein TNCV_1348731 [Trichonephila clavipes]
MSVVHIPVAGLDLLNLFPKRSSDLNQLDFFTWGYLKLLVYETPMATEEDFKAWMIVTSVDIDTPPDLFERV